MLAGEISIIISILHLTQFRSILSRNPGCFFARKRTAGKLQPACGTADIQGCGGVMRYYAHTVKDNKMQSKNYIAHVKNVSGKWEIHTVQQHLEDTASSAKSFAAIFNNGDWAELAAYWHDLGKYLPAWQAYLCRESGYYDEEAQNETAKGRPNHSTAGAVLSFDKIKKYDIARILAYIIGGHHAGLPDWYPDYAGGDLQNRLFKNNTLNIDELNIIKSIDEAAEFIKERLPISPPLGIPNPMKHAEHLHLWIRMLFSCLVDADYLDTEKFMKPEQAEFRGNYPQIKELKLYFDKFIKKKQRGSSSQPINLKRNEILEACREKASLESGFFSLNVPTGGGKTLSSMAFALGHALHYGKKRIIMAIPYTSIIEQTAKVYKYGTDNDDEIKNLSPEDWLFGEDAVLEHHSNIDPADETNASKLATENWDAPIIVTTNVQLFESLLASKPSECRKLHNLADSIIILDEAQMLPPEYFKPILSVLRGLVNFFGVTVVLCTATQPAFEGRIGSQGTHFTGIENVRSIIDNPGGLAKEFKRVQIKKPDDLNKSVTWEELAEKLCKYHQVITVVNRRSDCRELHSLMPEGTIHISALMCGEERSKTISKIKNDLRDNKEVRVISTQLVEAGVDIDFPVVFRAMAGMDSIAQAAGRCNREGKLNSQGKLGELILFTPPKPAPKGLLRKGEDASKTLLRLYNDIELSPELFDEYFRTYYASINDFDKPKFQDRLVKEANEFKFQFRTFAYDFKLIDDSVQKGIFVWYKGDKYDSRLLIEDLKKYGPSPQLLRKLQRFTVNVPVWVLKQLVEKGMVSDIDSHGYCIQMNDALYRSGPGLFYDAEWDSGSLVF